MNKIIFRSTWDELMHS